MSFGSASKAQGKSHTFTNLELNGGYDCDCTGPNARGVDLLVQGGARIKKTLCVGNICVEGVIIGDLVGNLLIQDLQEAEPGIGINVVGNLILHESLNMLCGTIENAGHLYVGNIYGSCPTPSIIQIHNNLHILNTDPIIGGKITWESGIELGDTSTQTQNSDSIAIGKSATTTFGNTTVIGHSSSTLGINAFVAGPGALGGQGCVVLGSNAQVLNNTAWDNIIAGTNASCSGSDSIVLCSGSLSESNECIVQGVNAHIGENNHFSIALGSGADIPTGGAEAAMAFGPRSLATALHSIALGGTNNPLALGAEATGISSIAVGSGVDATYHGAQASYVGSIAVGAGTISYASVPGAIASNVFAIAFGSGSQSLGDSSMAFGVNSIASGQNSMSFGTGANAAVPGSIVLGSGITSTSSGIFMQHRLDASLSSPAAWIGNELIDTASSARYKQNIRSLENIDNKFDLLRPVRFNAKPEFGDSNQEQIGLIAEEVYEIFPEVVITEPDGVTPKNIAYDRLVTVAIKEIQRLKEIISQLLISVPSIQSQ